MAYLAESPRSSRSTGLTDRRFFRPTAGDRPFGVAGLAGAAAPSGDMPENFAMEGGGGRRGADDSGRPEGREGKRSWAELRGILGALRYAVPCASPLQPTQIAFRRTEDGRRRVYYLVNSSECWNAPLLRTTVPDEPGPRGVLAGESAIEPVGEGGPRRSREQQLLSERQRSSACGPIATFQLHPRAPAVIFPLAGGLYSVDDIDERSTPLPLETRDGSFLAAAMCPDSPPLVAYSSRGDLWLTSRRLAASGPLRLTYAFRGTPRLADDPRQAGVPSYVTQEEFSRYSGFWWRPNSEDGVHRLLYEEVDESDVDVLCFPSHGRHNGDVEEFRFPRAGTANATSILRLLQFRVREKTETSASDKNDRNIWDGGYLNVGEEPQWTVTDIQYFDLRKPLEEEFPWIEYIPRIGWTPCGKFVWCQVMDRRQQRLEIILIPLEEFCVPFRYANDPTVDHAEPVPEPEPPAPDRIPMQVLLSERSPDSWINVHDILHFLPMNDPTEIRFIWASEETGHLHLYLVTSSITGSCDKREVSPTTSSFGSNMDSKIALTCGNWEVIGKDIWVDEQRGLIYFIGLKETPLERHLYYVSFQWELGRAPRLLTERGYSHVVDMDDDCEMVAITRSNLHSKPICQLFRLRYSPWDGHGNVSFGGVVLESYGPLLHPCDEDVHFLETKSLDSPWISWKKPGFDTKYTPELYSTRLCEGTGEEIHAMVFRPVGVDRDKPCPTVLHVYGGPVAQTVSNTFKGMRQLRMHMMAARGYCVVCIDSRGSKHRGMKFESHLRCRMGTVELEDQIEVLKWLADHIGCIDLNRVAVHGWSYGGYLSLMALVQYPELFKICIACAPVTSWHLYDTAYTERYMDLPNLNPTGYARGSVIKYAEHFPDQENRLLIVHGLQDENVHFLHTQQLIEALVRAGKPYQLQVYPGERHSLRHPEASAHYEATLLAFLQNNL